MTPAEHIAQRDRVAASLLADDLRESLRTVYPVRRRESVPGAAVAVAVARVAAETVREYDYPTELAAWVRECDPPAEPMSDAR